MDVRIVFMERYITPYIQQDLDQKIILLTGPRQTGKTTLSKMREREKTFPNGAEIRRASSWLSQLHLH
jgi:uncharacterized protein